MHTYRVWMKDGYATMVCAENEAEARKQAGDIAKRNIEGAAMDAKDKRQAVTVDYVDQLD